MIPFLNFESLIQNANFYTSKAKAPTQSTVTVTDRIALMARSCQQAPGDLNHRFICNSTKSAQSLINVRMISG
jgi:hypothetical protein